MELLPKLTICWTTEKKKSHREYSDHNGSNDKTSGKIPNRQNINTLLTNPWIKIQKGN